MILDISKWQKRLGPIISWPLSQLWPCGSLQFNKRSSFVARYECMSNIWEKNQSNPGRNLSSYPGETSIVNSQLTLMQKSKAPLHILQIENQNTVRRFWVKFMKFIERMAFFFYGSSCPFPFETRDRKGFLYYMEISQTLSRTTKNPKQLSYEGSKRNVSRQVQISALVPFWPFLISPYSQSNSESLLLHIHRTHFTETKLRLWWF